MVDYHKHLLSPVAKLDIKDLIDDSHSSSHRSAQSSTFSRSSSITSPHTQYSHTPESPASCSFSNYSTGTAASNHFVPQPVHGSQQPHPQPPPPLSNTAQAVFQQNPGLNPAAASAKRPPPNGSRTSGSPNRSKGKWTPAENAKIIVLRGRGMKWDDISQQIPGRSAISCRLHYQNYLEKRADWGEEQRNKLARVYDRLKPDLWNPIATELGVPWRACEAMHWALGEAEMCRRANVLPFPTIASNRGETAACGPAPTPSAGRVAQRDRMRGSTRVFEGQDITSITTPTFQSVNGNPTTNSNPQTYVPYTTNNNNTNGVLPASSPLTMTLPGISNGQSFPGYLDDSHDPDHNLDNGGDDNDNDNDDDDLENDSAADTGNGSQPHHRVRKRRLGNRTRLPGLAELDRTIAADFAALENGGRRLVSVKREDLAGHHHHPQQSQQQVVVSRRIKHEHGHGHGGRKGSVGSSVGSGSGGSNSRRSR